MGFGIFGNAQQAGFYQGQNWERNNSRPSTAAAGKGVGVAIAGLAAVAQARKSAAAYQALAYALRDALVAANPNHPLANKEECQKILDSVYDEG